MIKFILKKIYLFVSTYFWKKPNIYNKETVKVNFNNNKNNKKKNKKQYGTSIR